MERLHIGEYAFVDIQPLVKMDGSRDLADLENATVSLVKNNAKAVPRDCTEQLIHIRKRHVGNSTKFWLRVFLSEKDTDTAGSLEIFVKSPESYYSSGVFEVVE